LVALVNQLCDSNADPRWNSGYSETEHRSRRHVMCGPSLTALLSQLCVIDSGAGQCRDSGCAKPNVAAIGM